jgi:competence protein CoiA
MLVAKMDNEYIILSNQISREKLRELKDTQSFTCPACKEPLNLKIGKIKIPHFAHQADSNCLAHFSENESEMHILGKSQLFDFFSKRYRNVSLEPYLQPLQQRPDLLVQAETQKYAIEFQCSSVDLDLIEARTKNYIQHQYEPIWILQTPKHVESKQGLCKIQLTSFQKYFIEQVASQLFLVTYSPSSMSFYYLTNLLYLHGNSYLATIQALPISHQKFPFMLPKKLSFIKFQQYYSTYLTFRQKYLKNKIFLSRAGVNDPLLRSIYELKLNRLNLPLFIGVPTKLSYTIPLFAVEWQVALFYYASIQKVRISTLSLEDIKGFLQWLQQECTSNQITAVLNYLEWLNMIGVSDVEDMIKQDKIIEALYSHLVALSYEN